METVELIREFVNTADLEEGSDKLVDARGLQYWLVFHGLAQLRHRATDEEAAEARAVREALRDLLSAHTGVDVDREVASRTLDIAARNAGLSVRFVNGAIALVPDAQGTTGGLGRLLAAGGQAMAHRPGQRPKACRPQSCRSGF